MTHGNARALRWAALGLSVLLCSWLVVVSLPTKGARGAEALAGAVSLAPPFASLPELSAPASEAAGASGSPGFERGEGAVPRDIPEIDALMAAALRSRKTPGAVVVVGRRNGIIFRRAYGQRALLPERQEMTPDTIFDLASLTKPLVVGTLVQWLVETGKLRLEDRAAAHVPEFGVRGKQDVTVEQLLLHTSGLPPVNPLREYRQGVERARALTLGSWLFELPGKHFIYSDVGYIALGELIERVTGETLDRVAARVIWQPLGMSDTRYCRRMCLDPRVAPTELAYGWQKSPIRGEVHDPRAYRLGGVAGNAGLFSTADDLAKFARMLLGEGAVDGVRILTPASVRQFTEPRRVPSAVRALGWDVSSGFSAPRGKELSERAFGHGGHTGTSLWIDPELDLFVVFLGNRNHPYGTGKVTDLQGAIADRVVRALHPGAALPSALPQVALHPMNARGAGNPGTELEAGVSSESAACGGGAGACAASPPLHDGDG